MSGEKPVEVQAVLARHEGPWIRTRGGQDEYFLKLHYAYFVEGSMQFLKKEVSFKSKDEVQKILTANKVANYIVDANNPGKTLSSTEQPFMDFIILFFASIVLLVIEYRYRDTEKRD